MISELAYIGKGAKLGKNVTKLTFKMTAHNNGVPLYCCVDDIAVQPNK